MKLVLLFPKQLVLAAIRVYQKTLSFDHGSLQWLFPEGYCRYYPSCSEYGYQSIQKYGVVYGGVKTVWRVLRCNPWSHGGHDPVN